MEADDAAGLVLGHLDEPDADQGAELFLGDAQAAGQVAGQVGGKPAPQLPRPGVEQHRSLVLVAVRAHRLAEPGVAFDMAGGAGDVPAMRAAVGPGVAAGSPGQHGLAAHPPGVDRPERRRGEGGEHARVRDDRLRDALAASQARADERGVMGVSPQVGAAWPASSCARAHRRGPLPPCRYPGTPPQRTPRRNAPLVMRFASWPGPVDSRQVCLPPGERPAHRAGTPRIVRVGPSSVKGAPFDRVACYASADP